MFRKFLFVVAVLLFPLTVQAQSLPNGHPNVPQFSGQRIPVVCGNSADVFEYIVTQDPVFTPFAQAEDDGVLLNIFVNADDNSVIVTITNVKTHQTCDVFDGNNFRPSGAKPEIKGIDN